MTLKNKLSHYRLSVSDYESLKTKLQREPLDIEFALASALWNEHCSYKSSRVHLKKFRFPTQKKISGQEEQAGLVDFGQKERIVFKMESHNHPSFITPYQGAATGVGGILRDIFAMNARPLLLANYLCFGSTVTPKSQERVSQVVKGIGDYGNCIGVPTITGQTEFSKKYDNNILVNAMALGYLGKDQRSWSSTIAAEPGHFVVYAGSTTGRDGILGASMASESFGNSKKNQSTVQIGDPFFGKQLLEACLEAGQKNLILACQDMGAAGLTCSSFEMAEKSQVGIRLDLCKVPLRDKSMQPEDILLSESQERMLFVCKPSSFDDLKACFDKYELELAQIGKVTDTGSLDLYYKNKLLTSVDPKKWQAPEVKRSYKYPEPARRTQITSLKKEQDIKARLIKLFKSCEGRSREFIYTQYDKKVGTVTLQSSPSCVGTIELPESKRELAVAMGCRNYLMELDVREGAKDAIYFPALQMALKGFTPWAVTDCLNFGSPEKPDAMGDFVLSVNSIKEACVALDTPVVSGNVSFYNESSKTSITPTPSIVMLGLKEKNISSPSCLFHASKEKVYLIYQHQFIFPGLSKRLVKDIENTEVFGALQDKLTSWFVFSLLKLVQSELISTARVVGKFGLLYTISRMCLEKNQGFSFLNFDKSFFQERLYECVISVHAEQEEKLKTKLEQLGLKYKLLGETGGKCLDFGSDKLDISELKQAYLTSWKDISI